MSAETGSHRRLEIAHVLFVDIVGYSKLLLNEQSKILEELNEVVRSSEQVRLAQEAGALLRLPTGDGIALIFRNSPEAPAQCALEIAQALKSHSRFQLRMGIHSGPVNEVTDVNERDNIAGAGINMAQRVIDCGDAGHILLSKHVAEDLEQDDRWRPLLHDLGTCEVKHGVRVGVTNLYSDEVGNPQLPKKFQTLQKHRSHVRWAEVAIAFLVLAAAVAAFIFVLRKPTRSVLSVAEKSIAVLPFENLNEEKAIAEQLQARLSPNEKTAIEKAPTTDLAAFDLYTRAKTLLLSTTFTLTGEQNMRQAVELLNQAVTRDPAFFEAYYQLAYAHGR